MIGVSEIQKLLNQESSLEECTRAIQAATRQYAKRQTTWFKKQPFVLFAADRPLEEAVEYFKREQNW
jgi:tRNA A37 N6-isopentenylltransferase MiaA